MSKAIFLMDGIDISSYGIHVSESKGWYLLPSFKDSLKNEWSDENGHDIDLSRRYVNARTIELSCFCYAATNSLFLKKYIDFINLIDKPKHRRISLIVDELRFEFDVYRSDEVDFKKEYDNSSTVGQFSLKLIENQPIKKTIKFKPTTANKNTVSIAFGSNKLLTISWGDGIIEYTKPGVNTYTHKYVGTKDFFPLIQGDIDAIDGLTTNGTILWSR